MGENWKRRLSDFRAVVRNRRKMLYMAGACMLASGIALDLVSAVLESGHLALPGMVLPIAGSILLLTNYIAAMGRKGPLNHKDAADEAALGTMYYLYLGLCILTLFLYAPGARRAG